MREVRIKDVVFDFDGLYLIIYIDFCLLFVGGIKVFIIFLKNE